MLFIYILCLIYFKKIEYEGAFQDIKIIQLSANIIVFREMGRSLAKSGYK